MNFYKPIKFQEGDPMAGAFFSMLFFMGASFGFKIYCLMLVYLAYVGV